MPQNHEELQIEILWSLVNLTSVKDTHKMSELIEFGLFEAVLAMLDESVESLEKCELSLTVLCNCITDSDKTKTELLQIEQVKGQMRLGVIEKIDIILQEIEKQSN